jgi:predicted TIM-barrel enzyme
MLVLHKPALDVKYLYDNTGAEGFFGGSTFERVPIEEALINITKNINSYKKMIMIL